MLYAVVLLLPVFVLVVGWLLRGDCRPAPPVRIFRAGALPAPRPEGDADPTKWLALLQKLEKLGFYNHLAPADRAAAKQADFEARWPFAHDGAPIAMADAEDLYEIGPAGWLNENAEALARRGVSFRRAEDVEADGALLTRVDDREFLIRTDDEASGDGGWSRSADRYVGLVNTLLSEAGSAERLFWIHGGEDGVVAFLTPEVFAEITLARLIPAGSWPYGE